MVQPALTSFGVTSSGQPVEEITLNNGILTCQILTLGATLRTLYVPSQTGEAVDVVLGYDTLEEYQHQDGYLGAVIGRYANRIAKGQFSLNGRTYSLAVNNGPNHLHGGLVGFSHQVWSIVSHSNTQVVLALGSPHMQEGYPGNLTLQVSYRLEGQTLRLRYQAQADQDTPCNLTNHSYFNLSGHRSGPVLGQTIRLWAEQYLPTDATNIPLGRLAQVSGTPMDLRQETPLGAHIEENYAQLVQARGYDHCFVVDGPWGLLRMAAQAHSPNTGILMDTHTTLPGLQLYTANFLDQGRGGKDGAVYGPRHAFCLESQFYPDAPNQSAFPSAILKAGQLYDHVTQFTFSHR